MITVTIKDVLDDNLPDCRNHYIYRFYDGKTTFYIGKSWDIEDRISTHLGVGSRMNSNRILNIVNNNLPDSLSWNIDIYALRDCEPQLHENLDKAGWIVEALFQPEFIDMGIMQSEEAMIKHYRPCLNVLNNASPSALPEKYTHAKPGTSSALSLKI